MTPRENDMKSNLSKWKQLNANISIKDEDGSSIEHKPVTQD